MYTCPPLKSNEDEKFRAKFGPTKNEYYYVNKDTKQDKPANTYLNFKPDQQIYTN